MCEKIDVLFVIDNSNSMDGEQENLATNMRSFAALLDEFELPDGRLLDYRIGVTDTGVTSTVTRPPAQDPPYPQYGQDGLLRYVPEVDRRWIERSDPDARSALQRVARVGTGGPPYEQQLRAIELAIAPATNPGFVREDALLAVVLITDEEDCSFRKTEYAINGIFPCTNEPDIATPASFVASFDQAKGGRGRWAAAVIAAEESCVSAFGSAETADRLVEFADLAQPSAIFGDICEGNLTRPLERAIERFKEACENFGPIL